MINPLNQDHRQRLAKALDFSHQEIQKYNRMRANTIKAYLGISDDSIALAFGFSKKKYQKRLPKGNLLQLAGLNHQIALAYGEPRALVKARTPENAGLAEELGPALNRMAALLDLGEIHRDVAADSYFGYGIYKVAVGFMPPAAQVATGLEIGPCVWRVGQNNFLYDITADRWGQVGYVGDMYPMGLEDARIRFPDAADRLATYTDADRLDSPTVLPRPSRFHSPEQDIWLVDLYFPQAGLVGTWPIRADDFGTVEEEPLQLREYNGHWSGVYQVENHLYSPDELVPVAQAESVKAMHFLFNDILHLTSEQARNARVNPLYQMGNKDINRIMNADDRAPVSVANPTGLGNAFEIPGPSGSQTQYMAAIYQFFKDWTPAFDEPQRAPTATQGQLVRQTTNAIIAEARRKHNRALQLVFYKLGHLLVNNQDIVLPHWVPLYPGSEIMVDRTFGPGPHHVRIDDFDVSIEPYSTIYRSPEEKVGLLVQSSQLITQAMMMAAQGAPINVEAVIETLADYQDLPELKEWYEPADPLMQAKRASSEQSVPRIGTGNYTRTNVSEKTTAGALEQNLAQIGEENGQPPRVT